VLGIRATIRPFPYISVSVCVAACRDRFDDVPSLLSAVPQLPRDFLALDFPACRPILQTTASQPYMNLFARGAEAYLYLLAESWGLGMRV